MIDMRHELGKQVQVAIAVLVSGSLFSMVVGYVLVQYLYKTIGYIALSFSGLILMILLFFNSLHYINPTTYNRLVLLLNHYSTPREVQPTLTRPTDDSPPSYKESWSKAFKQRTPLSVSTAGAEERLPPPVDVDLKRYPVGTVGGEERGNGRSEWRMVRGAKKHGKRSQEVCIQGALKSVRELQEEEENSPPPFEVAILELSAKELEKIHENLPQSSFMSTNDAFQTKEGFPVVLVKPSDVFNVEQEFRRGDTETLEPRSYTFEA